jgi:hypothetical protein
MALLHHLWGYVNDLESKAPEPPQLLLLKSLLLKTLLLLKARVLRTHFVGALLLKTLLSEAPLLNALLQGELGFRVFLRERW